MEKGGVLVGWGEGVEIIIITWLRVVMSRRVVPVPLLFLLPFPFQGFISMGGGGGGGLSNNKNRVIGFCLNIVDISSSEPFESNILS